jgi:hypothetical protein
MSVFVFPLIESEATLHEQRTTFFHVLGNDLGLAAECLDINKSDFLFRFTGIALPLSIDCHAEIGYGGPFGGVFEFRVAGEIASQDDFIEVCHNGFLFVVG